MAERQATYLAKLGHNVTVFTSGNKSSTSRKNGYKIIQVRSLNFIETRFGVPYPLISPLNIFKLNRLIKACDLVHIHDVFYLSSHYAGIMALFNKKPIYITQHVDIVEHKNGFIIKIQKLVYHSLGKLLFLKSDKIVVYNSKVKKFLVSLGVDKNKILQTHNGIDTDYYSPVTTSEKLRLRKKYGLPPNMPIVLFVGRLVHKKGFDLVFNAKSKDYLTIIAGGGSTHLKDLNTDNVIFYGPANQSEIVDLYRLSDIFVLPTKGEVFTLSMQEAMACGLPVVVAKERAYDKYGIPKDCIAFTERNADRIRSKTLDILLDKKLYKKMSHYSRTLSLELFSFQKNYPLELSIYGKAHD